MMFVWNGIYNELLPENKFRRYNYCIFVQFKHFIFIKYSFRCPNAKLCPSAKHKLYSVYILYYILKKVNVVSVFYGVFGVLFLWIFSFIATVTSILLWNFIFIKNKKNTKNDDNNVSSLIWYHCIIGPEKRNFRIYNEKKN